MGYTSIAKTCATTAIVVLCMVFLATQAQSTAKGPEPTAAGEIDMYITRSSFAKRPVQENSFTASFPSSANQTFFAGQEIRMRIATTLFNTEQFQHSSKTGNFHGDTPHNSLVSLWRKYQLYNNSQVRLNHTIFPGFNISGPGGVRVRVVPAYASRSATSGRVVPCREQTDVWAEFWGLSGRTFAWGKSIAYSAYATFTVPPFHWNVCVKDVSQRNSTRDGHNYDQGRDYGWREFDNVPGVQPFNEPIYRYITSDTMHADDYAAVKVIANGREHRTWNHRTFDSHDHRISGLNHLRGDQIKLVPAGMPCTYEKSSATADVAHNTHPSLAGVKTQYCGSNYIKAGSGDFVSSSCVFEGSVKSGVGFTGSTERNPWATHTAYTEGEVVPSGVEVLGYFQLPAVGKYDICFSPVNYRLSLLNVSITPHHDQLINAVPVWFKLFQSPSSSGCPQTSQHLPAMCNSYIMQFEVTDGLSGSSPHGLQWDTAEAGTGTWGTINVTGSGLSADPATAWEHSNPREYFATVGGDQFRLVSENKFATTEPTVFGDLYKRADGTRLQSTIQTCEGPTCSTKFETVNRIEETSSIADLQQTGSGTLRQYMLSAPFEGTGLPLGGCFNTDLDNYGADDLNGNPGTQCCTKSGGTCSKTGCALSETGTNGVTASADLGSHPRTPTQPWNGDGSGLSSTWAYVRFPPMGKYYICYKKAGTNNWRVIPRTNNRGYLLNTTYSNADKFKYHVNDTTQHSVGEFRVYTHDGASTLTKENHNIYDTSVTDASVVGSSLKIVKHTASCGTGTAEYLATSMQPGSRECTFAECQNAASCANCLGFADDSNTATNSIYFSLRIPAAYTTASSFYRVCFRHGLSNWYQLSNPNYMAHLYSSSASALSPIAGQEIHYSLHDKRQGTWAKITFTRRAVAPRFNSFVGPIGDTVRLVLNESYHGLPTTCATQWGSTASGTTSLQRFQPTYSSNNLGSFCDASSSAAACAASRITPSNYAGTNGLYPYTTVDSHGDSRNIPDTDGTSVFLTLPPSMVSGKIASYRVCYKMGHSNWLEAVPSSGPMFLTVTTQPTITATPAAGTLYAGQFSYFDLAAPSTVPVTFATDLFKLVDSMYHCDREPAGSLSPYNSFRTLAGSSVNLRGGARMVSGDSDSAASAQAQPSSTTNARVYMALPIIRENGTVPGASATSTKTYRMCYMSRTATSDVNHNWYDLGSITLTSLGVVYDAVTQPLQSSVANLKLLALTTTNRLNTLDGTGDHVKIVAHDSPCASGTMPYGVASAHVGQELQHSGSSSQETGLTNLGPADEVESNVATFTTTLPASGHYFSVCYKAVGKPWVEIEQVVPAAQTQPLLEGIFSADTSGFVSFTASTSIRSQDPVVSTEQTYSTGVQMTSTFVGGATGTFTVVGSGITLSTGDTLKLVRVADEVEKGVWQTLNGVSCDSKGDATWSMSSAGTAEGFLPTTPGQYLVCYQMAGNTTWAQPASGDSDYTNPIYVIHNNLHFEVELGASESTITVFDLWEGSNVPFGGLVADDLLYLTTRDGVCGTTAAFDGTAASSSTKLVNSSLSGTTTPRRHMTVSWLNIPIVSQNFWAKPCYYKSQRTTTTSGSSSLQSYLSVGWYELSNYPKPAHGHFYSVNNPTKVVIDSCPNSTVAIRSGETFELNVTVQDDSGTIIPFSDAYAREIQIVGDSSLQNSFGGCKVDTAPQYGWLASNLRQYTTDGYAKFVVSPMGPCPTGESCSFHAASPGLTDSVSCTFTVTTVAAVLPRAVSFPTETTLDSRFSIRVAGFASDGAIAHTSTDTIFASVASNDGLNVIVGGKVLTNETQEVGTLADGYVAVDATVTVIDPAVFTTDTTIVIDFYVNGVATPTESRAVIVVKRPVVTAIHIVDVYPERGAKILDGASTHVQEDFVPSWEPTDSDGFLGGGHSIAGGQSAISAAAGYHFVAQQYYTVVLRPVLTVNGVSSYATRADWIDASKRTITIDTSSLGSSNAILNYGGDCGSNPGCGSNFGAVTFGSAQQKLTFRFKNADGCSKATPCTIPFKFGGLNIGSVTSFTTPVRSVATNLDVTCYVNTKPTTSAVVLADLTGTKNSCASSTIERGWILVVNAVDDFGQLDEYFDGNIVPTLSADASELAQLTTIENLRQGTPKLSYVAAANGVATLPFVTLSRQCGSSCSIQVLSDWGTRTADLGSVSVTGSTHHLACSIATPLITCAVDSDGICTSASGKFSYDTAVPANNENVGIYTDTNLCVDVEAVNEAGEPTLYDTNWVHYHLTDVQSGASLSIKDSNLNTDFRKRYQPMVQGKVRFCFTVSGEMNNSATFGLRFGAQRFDSLNHWTQGATGECHLNTLRVFKKKLVGDVKVITNYGKDGPTSLVAYPTSTPHWIYERTLAAKPQLNFDVLPYDHYGNIVQTSAFAPGQENLELVLDHCNINGLNGSCVVGSVGTSAGDNQPAVTAASDPRVTGAISVALRSTPISKLSAGTLTYNLEFDKYCIGCFINLRLKKVGVSGDEEYTTIDPTTGSTRSVKVTAAVSVLLGSSADTTINVGFVPDSSPTRYWHRWQSTDPGLTGTILFNDTCVTNSDAGCKAVESKFLNAACDSRSTAYLYRNGNNDPLEMMVTISETDALLNSHHEISCANDDCNVANNIKMQVDIMNSFSVGVSVGTQTLTCLNGGCIDDNSNTPKKNIAAFGTTAVEAIAAFQAAGYVPHKAQFTVAGLYPSNFYTTNSTDSTYSDSTMPSRGGHLRGSVSNNATGATASFETALSLIWRGGTIAKKFAVLDTSAAATCPLANDISCIAASGSCAYTGYKYMGTRDDIAFDYTSTGVVGKAFPFTVDLQSNDGARVFGASGSVTLTLASWHGCNNGGTMSVTGDMSILNGRFSVMVSFSQPCEKCVLKAVLTPNIASDFDSKIYADIINNPRNLIALSKPFAIGSTIPAASHVLVTSDPSAVASRLTVADTVTIDVETVTRIGNMAVVKSDEAATIVTYNSAQSTAFNQWWYGNGGILRSSKGASAVASRHATVATVAGTGSISFLFTRTCTLGCKVSTKFEFANGNHGSFAIRNSASDNQFIVTTVASKYVSVGFRPRSARQNNDYAISLWHMGSEASDIRVAGMGTTKFPTPATVTQTVLDETNGDGGLFTHNVFRFDRTEIHRMRNSRTTNQAVIKIGTETHTVVISTTATRLRVVPPTSGSWSGSYPSNAKISFTVLAVDANGFTDLFYGGYGDCGMYNPFFCDTSAQSVSVAPTTNISTVDTTMLPFDATAATVTGTIANGQGAIQAEFASPVRHAFPQFSTASLSGVAENHVDIASPTNNFAYVVGSPTSSAATAFVPASVSFAMVRDVTGLEGSFIVGAATNNISLTFTNCPERTCTGADSCDEVMTLAAGYLSATIVFSNPAQEGQLCKIKADVTSTGESRCSTCSAEVEIEVKGVAPSGGRVVAPTNWDNDGLGAGLKFGAVNRPTLVAVQPVGKNGDSSVGLTSCDDPTTSTVETCTLDIKETANCAVPPTITGTGALTTDVNFGAVYSKSISWSQNSGTAYDCEMELTFSQGSNVFLQETVTVHVCTPYRLHILSNFTRIRTYMTGVEYDMHVASVDGAGQRCMGDSQASATSVTLDVVDAVSHATVGSISAINTNATQFFSPVPYTGSHSASVSDIKLMGGAFKLRLVFTNSSILNGLDGIKVRISSGVGAVLSPRIETIIAATKLRFATPLPRYAVSGRPLYIPGRTSIVVEAVDAVSPDWVEQGLIPVAPNVASRPQDSGSDAPVSWSVYPPQGAFPLTFASGTRDDQLFAGRANWTGVTWTGKDTTVEITISTNSKLAPTATYPVTFQTTHQLAFDTSLYQPTAMCTEDGCVPPNGNATFPNGHSFTEVEPDVYSIFSLNWFPLFVGMLDKNGNVVNGDHESVVEAVLEGTGVDTVHLATAKEHSVNTTHYARLKDGRAAFNLSFVGATTNLTSVKITFRCPPTRPQAFLRPGDVSDANPCYGKLAVENISSAVLKIRDSRPPTETFKTTEVLEQTPILKFRSLSTDVETFPIDQLAIDLSKALYSRSLYFMSPTNAEKVIETMSCLVDRDIFGSADLGSTVCQVEPGMSTPSCSMNNNVSCPRGVLRCACSSGAVARARQLRRYLLAVGNGTDVQGELSFALWRATAFTGSDTEDIKSTLAKLKTHAEDILRSDPVISTRYQIDANSVGVRYASETLITVPPATPAPTPVPTDAPPPPPPPPVSTPASSAGDMAVLTCLLAALLLVLF